MFLYELSKKDAREGETFRRADRNNRWTTGQRKISDYLLR